MTTKKTPAKSNTEPAAKKAPAAKTTKAAEKAPAAKTTKAAKKAPAAKTTKAAEKTPAKKAAEPVERTPVKKTAKAAEKAPVKKIVEHAAPAAKAPHGTNATRYAMIAILAVAAFFGAYRFASASNQQGLAGTVATAAGGLVPATGAAAGAGAGAATGGGGGCCGGGGAPIEGAATVSGGVQKIDIDLSSGSYNPNVIKLKAGVPTEITFGQSSGCTAQVQSSDLGFSEDLSSGPKTVKIGALKAGTYNFACGMNMVTGQIVVQ